MIPGKVFTFADGVERVLPPLTFRQMREFDENGTSAEMGNTTDARKSAIAAFRVIHAALARNYPELKVEQMEDLLDRGLVKAILTSVILGELTLEERTRGNPPPGQ